MEERIQKWIAASGYCSRRKAEELIIKGKVLVNGKRATIGEKADPYKDIIKIGSHRITLERRAYYILNKPKGILVTMNDPMQRNTIYSLQSVKRIKERVFPVGRLDAMSQGLLILTNDGEFANKIMHPRYNIKKTYKVRCEPQLADNDKAKIEQGFMIEGIKTNPARITRLEKNEFLITIHEGRNRIIRNMLEALNYKIYLLKRISIGHLKMNNLNPGEVMQFTKEQIEKYISSKPSESEDEDRSRHKTRF